MTSFPSQIDDWAAIGTRLAATGWTLDNDGSTPAGDAYLSGTGTSANWTAIRGAFGGTVTATESEAVIVRGQFAIEGAEVSEWNPFRFGLFRLDDPTVETGAHGYLITNQTGTQTPVTGATGIGSAWAVNGGSWISTNSGGTQALGSPYNHAPRRSVMPTGRYDFEMSAQPKADGSTEFRWYIFHTDGQSYWHAGVHTDTTAQKTDFDGFLFSFRPEVEGVTGINLYGVEVDKGSPVEIPEAPFSSFYVDTWGAIGTRLAATGWTLDNDSTTLVGDAYLSGTGTSGNWTAIRGGFGGTVTASESEAIIVRGQIAIEGAEVDEWNPFRFGLFRHDDEGSLVDQYTPDARWGYTQYANTDSAQFVSNEAQAFGYLITNQTGANGAVSGNGGNGSAWAVNGGSWISTFSGGTVTLGSPYDPAPRRPTMPAGTYDFELSAQPQADGTTEFRWYILHEDEETYWHAGVHTDTTAQKAEFDGFVFSFRPEVEGVTGIDLYEVEVDRGAPITIPEAPFASFYVDTWGFLGGKFGGATASDSLWALTPGALVGDVTIAGEAPAGWAAVAGSFGPDVTATEAEAIRITATVTLEGGSFEEAGSFRVGLLSMDLGAQDSTETVGYVWTGAEAANGYLFAPANGTANGTIAGVAGGPWYDMDAASAYGLAETMSSGTPSAGSYSLEISVQPTSAGSNTVAVRMIKEDGSYLFAARGEDESGTATSAFNTIAFAVNNSTTTGLTIEEFNVDKGLAVNVSNEGPGGETGLPTEFALRQNYPNPFGQETRIRFDTPEAADVKVEVFNLLGQRVMTLVDGQLPAGYHEVDLDAQHLASGVYVYRIDAGDFVDAKRMVIVR